MASVNRSATIAASASDVWTILGDFNGLPKFSAGVAESTLEGSGVGAVRTLTLADNGGVITERLESMDEGEMCFSYSIVESPLPVQDYLSTMKVIASNDSSCEVEWSSTFEPAGISAEQAEAVIGGIYDGGLSGLTAYFG